MNCFRFLLINSLLLIGQLPALSTLFCSIPSVEIPTRCSFVIEFIIPKFIEGSTCFQRHTAHYQELKTVFATSGLYTHVVTGVTGISDSKVIICIGNSGSNPERAPFR